jgi:hypothetical protein
MNSLLVSVLLVLGLVVSACDDPQRTISDGALRNATASGAAAELRKAGYRTAARLACRTPASNTRQVVRVRCSGRTTGHAPIAVDGIAYAAGTRHPRQRFVILVNGREVVSKDCLSTGCDDR